MTKVSPPGLPEESGKAADGPAPAKAKPRLQSSLLLPASGSLLTGAGTNADGDGQSEIDWAKAGDDAKQMASRATAYAQDKAPELKKKAQEAASFATAFAQEKAPELREKAQKTQAAIEAMTGEALKQGTAGAKVVIAALRNAETRKTFFATYGKKIAGGLVVSILLIGGGWMYAAQKAKTIATDQIEGFLIRSNLGTVVTYKAVSASPFGSSVRVEGISFAISPTANATIDTLKISAIQVKDEMLLGLDVSAEGVEIPLLALSQNNNFPGAAMGFSGNDLIGLGYTTITGQLSMSAQLDSNTNTYTIKSSAGADDIGDAEYTLKVGGFTPALLNSINSGIVAAGDDQQQLQRYFMNMFSTSGLLNQLTLAGLDAHIDNGPVYRRLRAIPNTALPSEDGAAPASAAVIAAGVDVTALVRAGFSPSEAKQTSEILTNWLKNGGSLRIATNITRPLPLFLQSGYGAGQPAQWLTSSQAFIAATRVKITD